MYLGCIEPDQCKLHDHICLGVGYGSPLNLVSSSLLNLVQLSSSLLNLVQLYPASIKLRRRRRLASFEVCPTIYYTNSTSSVHSYTGRYGGGGGAALGLGGHHQPETT